MYVCMYVCTCMHICACKSACTYVQTSVRTVNIYAFVSLLPIHLQTRYTIQQSHNYRCTYVYCTFIQNTPITITVLTPTLRTYRCLALETYAATFAPHQQIPTGMSLSLPNPEGGPDLKVGSWLKKQRQRRQVRGC